MALVIREVSYEYEVPGAAPVPALDRASLSIGAGEVVLIAGQTGSGKSTLMRIAAGLLASDRGVVELDGVALDPASHRGQVGLVFQDPEAQLFADTVLEDVAFGPRNLGATASEAARTASDALADVGLDPLRYGARSPFSLSGGQGRLAAIAGVLAMKPRYLLFDEPTSGLDAAGRSRVRAVIAGARRASGVAIVTHDLEELLPSADRLVLLADGRIVFEGSRQDVLADPSIFGRAGLSAPPVLEAQQLAAERGVGSPPFVLDPVEAAEKLVAAWGRSS